MILLSSSAARYSRCIRCAPHTFLVYLLCDSRTESEWISNGTTWVSCVLLLMCARGMVMSRGKVELLCIKTTEKFFFSPIIICRFSAVVLSRPELPPSDHAGENRRWKNKVFRTRYSIFASCWASFALWCWFHVMFDAMLTGVFAISSYFIFSMLLSCCRRDNNGLELFFSDRWKLCAESAKMREECEESVEGTDEEERRTLVNKLDVLLIIATINLHAQRIDGYARDVGCYILNDDFVPPTIAIHCRQNFAGFMAFSRMRIF